MQILFSWEHSAFGFISLDRGNHEYHTLCVLGEAVDESKMFKNEEQKFFKLKEISVLSVFIFYISKRKKMTLIVSVAPPYFS